MNTTEKKLAASLLKRASDEFSNHGCNDMTLPDTPENQALAIKVQEWSGDPDFKVFKTRSGELHFYDWMLMAYLADALEKD
ncbi:MAG: hypothetical protein WC824_15695 [Bacteroidota bacterium]|jgi:hypothetical protein